MALLNTYCHYCNNLEDTHLHKIYHDTQYGFPVYTDNELFGRLILEINQAGLSWDIILKKQQHFKKAYSNFEIKSIANYTEKDRIRLLKDSGIVRNKLKINAAIHNARVIVNIQKEFGSFQNWLDENHPKVKDQWVRLFKKTFKFTGGEITNEFLMSVGYLEGAHDKNCPIYRQVLSKNPKWNSN